ncbi:hypothetical protein [Altererythrobacter sp. MF3-039]|uniref:hypothetical protein n=1 Tax=Altererythrobacter sp. MF3-039 TaxID=3252901 RepID=UPI00390CC931
MTRQVNRVIQSAREHIDTWNTRDNEAIAAMIKFPFVQFDHDGSMQIMSEADELFDFAALDQFSTNLVEAEVVQSGPAMTVIKISFQWEYPNQGFVGIGNAVWGFEQISGEFKLRWRQFLGWNSADE